jgi:hypothetical protein
VFDLYLYSINLESGHERSELPGSVTCAPPKRAARGRSRDYLTVLLSFAGDTAIVAGEAQKLLTDFTSQFYSTTGSTTFAVQSAVHSLNTAMLQRNLKTSQDKRQVVGLLNVGVLHDDQLIIGHCGQTHSFFLSGVNVHHSFNENHTEKGLGISKTAFVHFFHEQVKPHDMLLFSPLPPETWKESSLNDMTAINLEGIRQRLLNNASEDLHVQTVQFMEGKGQVLRRKLVVAAQVSDQAPERTEPPSATTGQTSLVHNVVTPRIQDAQRRSTPPFTHLSDEDGGVQPHREESLPAETPPASSASANLTEDGDIPVSVNKSAQAQPRSPARQGGFRHTLANLWLAGRKFGKQVDTSTKRLTTRIAPKLTKQNRPLSPAMMLFIAISIPIIIVAIATTIYIQRGRSVQHEYFLQQAREVIVYANESSDLNTKITYWQAALSFLDQAENFGSTRDSRELRALIQQNLDMLGGMSHLEFRPALADNLPSTAIITKIAAPLNDSSNIYLLDSSVGRVIHIVRKDQYQYSVDYQFACTPDSVTPVIGALIDFVVLPPNSIEMEAFSTGGAAILASDDSGNLLYCAPGKNPVSASLPGTNSYWGKITRIAISEGSLYVLDSANRHIWIYSGSEFTYSDPPSPFFDAQVPNKLDDITGMAVNNEELYLLHADSQMTACTYSPYKELKSTSCTDPTQYADMRTSSNPTTFSLAGIKFISMAKVDLPDQSLYLMDANGLTLNKFGFQLNLYHTYYLRTNPDYSSPTQLPSGFGVTSDQIAFFAFGNQLYVTNLQ